MGWEGTAAALGAQREGRKELGPEGREGASLTAVHLVRGVLAVHKLVAAAGVPNAGAVPAAELTHTTGRLYNSARPVPSAGASPWGPCQPRPDLPAQSACPGPPYRTLNQNPWDLGTKAQRGWVWGGAAGGGEGLRPGLGPTHCCRESHRSRPRSRPPRCTTACWTHSARCCTGGRSSCSGGCLQVGAGRSEQRLGAASDETLLPAWHGSHGGSPLHKLPTFSRGCREGGGFAPLTPTPRPVGTEAGDSDSGGLGVRVGALTAVGWLLVRLVLAVGDAVARQAKIDTLAVGTLELVLCTARGIHRWGERRGAS